MANVARRRAETSKTNLRAEYGYSFTHCLLSHMKPSGQSEFA